MVIKPINLDVWNKNDVTVFMNQGEVNSRKIYITFKDGSDSLNLDDKEVVFYAMKPDGTFVYNTCTAVNSEIGIVSLDITSQVVDVAGQLKCEVHIIGKENNILKIKGLKIMVLEFVNIDG